MTELQKFALNQICTAAVQAERQTGCPAEMAGAQAILETGWLKSAPENNCFGIKVYPGCYGRQLLKTKERFTDAEVKHFLSLGDGRTVSFDADVPPDHSGRRRCTVTDWFATFATLGDCFAKRAQLWKAGRYAPAATAYSTDMNLEKLIRAIAPIYATDENYADSVLKIIRSQDFQLALAAARRA